MNILLIAPNKLHLYDTVLPIGLAHIAQAALDAGHNVEMIDFLSCPSPLKRVSKSIYEFKPDIVGISVRNIDNEVFFNSQFLLKPIKELVVLCKKNTVVPIVLGGAGYSIFPQASLEYIEADYGISGNGEKIFIEFLKAYENKQNLTNLSNFHTKGNNINNPKEHISEYNYSSTILPDPSLFQYCKNKEKVLIPIKTRRGCPMMCSYCSTPFFEGTKFDMIPPSHIANTLEKYTKAGMNRFFFVDDNFNFPMNYAVSLCDKIIDKKIQISWSCIASPGKIDDTLVKKMAIAGCNEVAIGYESGSDIMLKNYNKKFSPKDIIKVSKIFKKYNISQRGFLLIGGPGENEDTIKESITLAEKIQSDFTHVTFGIRIFPHTQLAEQALSESIISPDDNLLFPKFYMSKYIKKNISEIAAIIKSSHPEWIFSDDDF